MNDPEDIFGVADDEQFSNPFEKIEEKDVRTNKTYKKRNVAKKTDHTVPHKVPEENKPVAVTKTKMGDGNVGGHTTPTVSRELVKEMVRREEIEQELVRTNGRYIESVDNAKPGVTFTGAQATPVSGYLPDDMMIRTPDVKMRADGVTIDGVLDTGAGAQGPVVSDKEYDKNDPRSMEFVTCGNSVCPYRQGCLRYRMNGKRTNKSVFFPESCRIDGIYIGIDETDFTGYSLMSEIESTTTPSF